jgi:hypothetical protein
MKYFQGDVQLSEHIDGLEPRSKNIRYMMVPQNLTISWLAWKKI